MTVSTNSSRISYTGNGVTTVFAFPYKFIEGNDLAVYVAGVLQASGYTVGTPSDSGANVTFSVAPAAAASVVIVNDPDLLQATALPGTGPFPSKSVETMADKLTLIVQRLKDLANRSFTLADGDATTATLTLPTPSAGQLVGWDGNGTALANYSAASIATAVVGATKIVDSFTGDGATTAFTLSAQPLSNGNTDVFVGGVYQQKSQYNVVGTTLTFTVAPPNGVSIEIEQNQAVTYPVTDLLDGTVSTAKIIDGAVTSAKIADGTIVLGDIASSVYGTSGANKLLQLDGTGKLPAVDGSQLTGITSGLAGFRNKLINGNFDIWQRGTSAVTTVDTYGADRWVHDMSGDTFSSTQGTFASGDTLYDTGGAAYFTQIAVTSVGGAGNYMRFIQKIEDVRKLAGKTITVSFWAKAASGTPQIGVELVQSFGSGGSPSAQVTGTGQAVTLSTTWTQYSVTITLPSINGKTIGTTPNTSFTQLNFWLDAGATFATRAGSIGQASKTVSIAKVQLEEGSAATAFEQRPYGTELALCQRYLPAWTGQYAGLGVAQALSAVAAQLNLACPVTPRVPPTGLTLSNFGHVTYTQPSGTAINPTGFGFNVGGSNGFVLINLTGLSGLTAGQAGNVFINNASGYLYATGCEL